MLALMDFSEPEPIPEHTFSSAERDDAYAEGFAAGQAAAEAAQAGINAEFVSALETLTFSYAEARRDVLAELVPFLRAIAEQLIPPAAHASLVPRVLDALETTAQNEVSQQVTLRAHASRVAALTDLLTERGITHATVVADPQLHEHAVRVASATTERSIDVSHLATEFVPIIESLAAQVEDQENHG